MQEHIKLNLRISRLEKHATHKTHHIGYTTSRHPDMEKLPELLMRKLTNTKNSTNALIGGWGIVGWANWVTG